MNDNSMRYDDLDENEIRGKRIAFYGRVSSKEQTKQETIKIQRNSLNDATKGKHGQLVGEYFDDGWSGEMEARPQFDILLDDIEEKGIEVVLITEPDRMARDFTVQKILERHIEQRGASVRYLSTPPPRNEGEQLRYDVEGLFAGLERGKIKSRTRRGKMKKAKSGLIVGGKAPYGFQYVERTRKKSGHYKVIEEQAHWVEKMFQWCAWEGLSIESIARQLTQRGVPTQTGEMVWRRSTIYNILTNETYAGVAYYNKRRSIPPRDRKKAKKYRRSKNTSRELRPKEDWIAIPVPSIINREIWERVQSQLHRNARSSPRNTRHPYLLRSMVFCGFCGLLLYGSASPYGLRYRCSNRHHRSPLPKTCFAKSVDASIVDSAVWETLFNALAEPEMITNQLKQLQKVEAEGNGPRREELDRLEKKLKKSNTAEKRAADLYANDEGMSIEKYKELVQRIRVDRERINRGKEELERQMQRSFILKDVDRQIRFLYADITSGLQMLSFEDKQKVVNLLVDKVVVTEEKLRIEGIIPPPNASLPTIPDHGVIASNSSPYEGQIQANWWGKEIS